MSADKRNIKLDAVRSTANILVVLIHMAGIISLSAHGLMKAWGLYFSQVIAPIALPTLFFISGYLRLAARPTLPKCAQVTAKLLGPYLLWNIIYVVLFSGAIATGLMASEGGGGLGSMVILVGLFRSW